MEIREKTLLQGVNGIIKEEYLCAYEVNNIEEAKDILAFVVQLYNQERPHMSIGNLTPNQLHHSKKPIKTKKLWKTFYPKKSTFVNEL